MCAVVVGCEWCAPSVVDAARGAFLLSTLVCCAPSWKASRLGFSREAPQAASVCSTKSQSSSLGGFCALMCSI